MRPALLGAPEVALRLNVSTARVWELIRTGVIPAVRLGRQVRVCPAALEDFIETGGSEGGARHQAA